MNVIEKEEDKADDEVCGPDGDDDDYDYDDHNEYAYVVRKLMLSPKSLDDSQRHKLFRTRCTMQGSLFDLIIDSGSQENIIGRDMVEKLKPVIEEHPNPYIIGWIK